jgi:hypothetical protein
MAEIEEKETVEAPVHNVPRQRVDEDLSLLVGQTVGRVAGETVRCVHVYADKYRCNWWADSEFGHRISRSRFLRISKTPDGLVIEPVPAGH